MMRALLVVGCLAGLLVGGALAPAAGIQTPVPDVGGGDDISPNFGESGDDPGSVAGAPVNASGTAEYGGDSAGGYPESTTVGGRLNLSDHEAFVAESPEPTRWRLGAYANYTGDGFERDDADPEHLSEPLAAGEHQPEYEVEVTPQRPFLTLPVPPEPAFAAATDRRVFVDSEGALTVEEPVASGESYTALSYEPPSHTRAAAASNGDYPTEIKERYTQLPEDTPDRLAQRTAEITADAETPYEAAVEIETWLQDNKGYSLDVTHDTDNDVATEFVFEMEEGYCQYFATSMVAMLRTQGIPARYVTGYGPGVPIDNETYEVRGEHAHAWVEVYVSDVGWVTFDPTPAEGREAAGRDVASLDDLGGDWDPDTEAEDNTTAVDSVTAEDGEERSIGITLSSDPVPGAEVQTTVTHENGPISDVTVTYNGKRVGETSGSGSVSGTVPYDEVLEIEVNLNDGSPHLTDGDDEDGNRQGATVETRRAEENAVATFELPTTATIEPLEEPSPGQAIDIVVTNQERPVADAEITVDGEVVDTTDADGVATLPPLGNETIKITAERGAVEGERTLDITDDGTTGAEGDGPDTLNVSVTPSLPVAVPGMTAEVLVTHEGDPVEDATVTLGGAPVGETGVDGRLSVRLPFSDSVTVVATAPQATTVGFEESDPLADAGEADVATAQLTGTVAITGMHWVIGGAAGAGGLLVVGVAGLVWRRDLTPAGLQRAVSDPEATAIEALVNLADAVDTVVTRSYRGIVRLREDPREIVGYLVAASGALRRWVGATERDDDGTESAVLDAWSELEPHVSVDSWRTSTPGEITRWAVERDGLPEEAVLTLRDAFRAVEYGDCAVEDREAAVREAIEEIRASQRSESEGES